jgi:hypothetical protein
MSFNINRVNNRIPEKNLQINTTPNAANLIQSSGTTNNSTVANITTLSLNNVQITANAEQLNSSKVTSAGIAESNKLLILDASRNISNINNISCNTLIANGQNITAAMFQVGGSDDLNNEYLTNIIDTGNTLSLKGLITDSRNNITNINSLAINTLQLNNNNISSSSYINTNLVIKQHEDIYPNIHSINSEFYTNTNNMTSISSNLIGTTSNTSVLNNYKWGGLAWSSELLLYVAVASGDLSNNSQINSIIISKDGHNWTNINAPISQSWNDIIWISKLKLFVAVSSNGNGQQIMTSSNGINWNLQTTLTNNITFTKLKWSNELNICIAIAKDTNNIIYSYNGINWFNTCSDLSINVGLNAIEWSSELGLFVATTNNIFSSGYRIVISSNGINWNYLPNVILPAQPLSIAWSSYLKRFIISNNSDTVISYSDNGFTWNNTTILGITSNIHNLLWIDELKIYIGFYSTNNNDFILYSKNGIQWSSFQTNLTSGSKSKNIIWSPELAQIIISMYEGKNSNVNNHRFLIITTNYIKKNANFIFYKNSLNFDYINNRIGFNIKNPNLPLEINSTDGNCLKLTTFSSNIEFNSIFNITNNGKLNINTSKFNILTDYSTYGLKLNNTLITTNVNTLNLLSSIINGTASKQLPLITDNNNNISNINLISCNSLIVNGNNISTNANNNLFLNNNIGLATPNKVLITDNNNNISNINILSSSNLQINNNKLIVNSSQSIINHNLTNINNIINKPNIEYIYPNYAQTLNKIRGITVHNATWVSLIWVSELQLYIALASANSTNNDRIFTSPDGITWTASVESRQVTASTSWSCITWSPELKLLVALNTSFNDYRISTSTDGFNWFPQHNTSNLNQSWNSICWASEINMFAAVSSNGYIMISKNGYNWTQVYQHSSSINLKSIIWANTLKLFIVITNQTSTNQILISSNGYNWTNINLELSSKTSSELSSITWSEELNILIASTTSNNIYYYSYNGRDWNIYLTTGLTNVRFQIIWIKDLSIFMMFNSAINNLFAYSKDGFNWNTSNFNIGILPQAYAWSNDLKRLVVLGSGGSAYVFNALFSNNALNTVVQQSNNFRINKTNGYIGLGISPSYQLELSIDSAAKASSSTWAVASDLRLKEDIEDANLDICYNNFKNINLVRYKWKDNIYSDSEINDRTQLGWIAQDVEEILPKSIITCNKFGYEDCKFLNSDQLLSTLYGTVQKLINNFKTQENNLNDLNNNIVNIETFLNNLEIDN